MSYYMNTIKMEDLVKSGVFGLAFLIMLMVASLQFDDIKKIEDNKLASNQIENQENEMYIKYGKAEIVNIEEIDIPL